jgi:hypothetical protein
LRFLQPKKEAGGKGGKGDKGGKGKSVQSAKGAVKKAGKAKGKKKVRAITRINYNIHPFLLEFIFLRAEVV